jgi:transposase InsO family protein
MISFIDEHRGVFGVEPICRLLPIAPSTYYENVAKRLDVDRLSMRARSDIGLKIEIRRVFNENFQVYGVRKVWRQLQREGVDAARCTVARLMRSMSLHGVIRGKPIRTTFSDKTAPSPLDRVNRQFKAPAPNRLWVSDFTYVATWQGFVYVAFVIDVFARRIVGWRASRTAHASFVLDALEQALHDRRPAHGGGLVHHSDRGVQYVSIRYSERLAEAGIEPSVGSVGDSYDNALAETINGLYKAEVIHRRGPWRNFEAVEFATLEWVDFRNGAVAVKYLELTRMQHDAVDRPRAGLNLCCGERGLLVSKSSSLAGMVLPSVVGAIAATPCLVQERFPRAHLVRVLEAMLGYSRPIGVIGYRVPARDLEDPALHARPVKSSWQNSGGEEQLRCGDCQGSLAGEAKHLSVSPHPVQHHADTPC